MKIIRTSSNYKKLTEGILKGEFYDPEKQPSLTDPSQAVEPKDIIELFSRGGSIRLLTPQSFGNVDEKGKARSTQFDSLVSNLNKMDKVDRAQARIDVANIINDKSDRITKNKKDLEDKKAKAKAKKDAEAELIKKQKQKTNPKDDE